MGCILDPLEAASTQERWSASALPDEHIQEGWKVSMPHRLLRGKQGGQFQLEEDEFTIYLDLPTMQL